MHGTQHRCTPKQGNCTIWDSLISSNSTAGTRKTARARSEDSGGLLAISTWRSACTSSNVLSHDEGCVGLDWCAIGCSRSIPISNPSSKTRINRLNNRIVYLFSRNTTEFMFTPRPLPGLQILDENLSTKLFYQKLMGPSNKLSRQLNRKSIRFFFSIDRKFNPIAIGLD